MKMTQVGIVGERGGMVVRKNWNPMREGILVVRRWVVRSSIVSWVWKRRFGRLGDYNCLVCIIIDRNAGKREL